MPVNWDEFSPVEESSVSEDSIDWAEFTPVEEPRRRIEPPQSGDGLVMPTLDDRLLPTSAEAAGAFTAQGLVGSAEKGIERAKIIPEVISLPSLKQTATPTVGQERRAFVRALSDPAYFAASTIPGVSPLAVESRFGPPSQVERMKFGPRAAVTETVRDIAEVQKQMAEIPQSPAQQRMAAATTQADKWKAWLQDPIELTTSIALESLPPAIAGATVGSAAGPGGTAIGAGMASGLTEFSSTFLDEASKHGYNVTDPASLEKFLNDEKAYTSAVDKGLTRASIVGGVDAVTAGTAGRFIQPALKEALKQRVIASGKELALQAAGGAGGEAAAQVATGQPLDPFDIAMEAIAEVGTGPAEIAGNLRAQPATQAVPEQAPVEETTPPLPSKDVPITIQKPDGTTYQAGFNGWQASKMALNKDDEPVVTEWKPSLSVLKEDKWSTGSGLPEGHKIVSGAVPPMPAAQKGVEPSEETKEQEKEVLTPEPPLPPGLGGASAGSIESGTGLKNVIGEQERVGFGLPEAYPTISRKMLPVWEASGEVLKKDPQAGAKLAAELKINPERGMTDEDSALLLRHKVALENAKNQAAEDSITAATPEAKQEAMNRFDDLSNQLLDLLDAAKFRGSQWGREGRWRQALAFEDYSFESMRRQKRMKADRELTPEEEAETKREFDEIAAKQKAAQQAEAAGEQKAKESDVKEAVTQAVKTARTRQASQKAAGVVRDLAAEQNDIVSFLKDYFIENGDLVGARNSIKKLMELLVEHEGITERLPLETRVHQILSGVDPTLTREGTLDLMSGYGQSKLPSQEPAKKIVRDISQQIISVRKLLDYFKGKRPSLTGMLRDAPSDIQRGWIKMVNEAKKSFKLEPTDDNAKAIKSATDAINTRLKNRIADLKQEIVTRQKIIRERSPSPYNAETLRLRQELAALQAQHAEIFGTGLTDAQKLDRLEKSAQRQIEELERQIKSGEIFPASKQAIGLTSDKLEAAKARLEELKLQRQFARESLQPRPEPEVVKNEARVKALDKQIAAIEKQLRDDAVFTKPKKERTPSDDARIVEREKRLAELKQERQFARERNQPGLEPHERFLLNYLLRIRQREASYKERLATGQFEKVPKPKRELSEDVLKALADVEKAKSDFQRGLHKYEQERRSRIQKIWDGIKKTRNAFVNIVSSYDFSAPRQAFGAILANISRIGTSPIQSSNLLAVPFKKMFQAWASEERARTIEQWRKNRENAKSGADKTMGIQYTDFTSDTYSKREENARSVLDEWAAIPLRTGNAAKTAATFAPKVFAKGVHMSNRAFNTFLNVTRALLADELLRANFQDRAPTEAELKVIGNLVNLMTGRGAISPKTAEVVSQVLWAPSLLASRAQLMAFQPFLGKAGREGGGRARLIVAKEYARIITSAALLFAISRMFDDKDEEEMTSSDFGKVVRGNTRVDLWGGHQQLAVAMARLIRGETTSISGDTRDISKMGQGEVLWNFFKNKTRPDITAVVKAAVAAIDLGKEPERVRVTPQEAAKAAVPLPLAVKEVIEVMRDRGMSEGAIIEALALFGAGVSVYEDREVQK